MLYFDGLRTFLGASSLTQFLLRKGSANQAFFPASQLLSPKADLWFQKVFIRLSWNQIEESAEARGKWLSKVCGNKSAYSGRAKKWVRCDSPGQKKRVKSKSLESTRKVEKIARHFLFRRRSWNHWIKNILRQNFIGVSSALRVLWPGQQTLNKPTREKNNQHARAEKITTWLGDEMVDRNQKIKR